MIEVCSDTKEEVQIDWYQHNQKSSFDFLGLPKEIRQQIYQPLRLEKISPCLAATERDAKKELLSDWAGLLRVSKFVNREVSQELYSQNKFELHSNESITITEWLKQIGDINRREIRFLKIDYGFESAFYQKHLDRKGKITRTFRNKEDLITAITHHDVDSKALVCHIVDHMNLLKENHDLRYLELYFCEFTFPVSMGAPFKTPGGGERHRA